MWTVVDKQGYSCAPPPHPQLHRCWREYTHVRRSGAPSRYKRLSLPGMGIPMLKIIFILRRPSVVQVKSTFLWHLVEKFQYIHTLVNIYIHGICALKVNNSLWPSDAIWHQRIWSSLFQVMAYCLFSTWLKPSPEPMMNHCELHLPLVLHICISESGQHWVR